MKARSIKVLGYLAAWGFTTGVLVCVFASLYYGALWAWDTWDAWDCIVAAAAGCAALMTLVYAIDEEGW